MTLALTSRPALATRARPRPAVAAPGRRSSTLRVRAQHDDEDIIPLLAPHPDHFTPKELERLAHPRGRLGGATQGEELTLLRAQLLAAEAAARERNAALAGGNWNADGEYVGSRWNVATVLTLVFFFATAVGLGFAVLGKGTLWGLDPDYASFF